MTAVDFPAVSHVLTCGSLALTDKQGVDDKRYGTISVKEPQVNWWRELGLESPEALIKVFVSESRCFTLVDCGKGLQAAQAERELANSGDLRGGSNAVAGGVSLKSKTADVVLTITDVRSSEQVALQQGHAKKTDIGWWGGGGGWMGAFAAAGASSYSNTEIGQVVAMAKAGKLLSKPNNTSEALRDLDAGAMLYPTGEKQGPFWKVMDDLGNEGWVPMGLLQVAK